MWLWMAVALAAAPEGVDLDDVFGWEDRAHKMLTGPMGCWDVAGDVKMSIALFQPPTMFSTGGRKDVLSEGAFSGRLVEGVWRDLRVDLEETEDGESADKIVIDVGVHPLFGLTSESPNDAGGATEITPANLVRSLVERELGATATSGVRWDDERNGLVLEQKVPITDAPRSPESDVVTFFPDAGAATQMDVVFPKQFKIGDGWVKLRTSNGQLHLRARVVDGQSIPSVESMSAVFGVLGYTLGFEQRLVYTSFKRCGPSAPEADPLPE